MTFPQTRITLIRRLVDQGDEADWRQFICDYWRPIRRFAMKRGKLQPADADDIASSTLEILIRNRLLLRWSEVRSAKLRTLLCSVVCRQLANHRRKKANQQPQIALVTRADAPEDAATYDVPAAELEAFENLWLDEILVRAVDSLQRQCLRDGKIDHFRVLFGRVCEGMSHAEVADCLGLELTTVQAWYQQARDLLAQILRQLVRDVVHEYAAPEEYEAEFHREWDELAAHLKNHGGLEAAIRSSHEALTEHDAGNQGVAAERLQTLSQMSRRLDQQP